MDEKVEAYLKLYERQMTHYEKTQEIEWKVSIGVWGLLAAAIVKASYLRATPLWLPFVAPILHAAWLLGVHGSQETDKKLWSSYRARAEGILGSSIARPYKRRELWRELAWVVVEVGVTAVMAFYAVHAIFSSHFLSH